MALGDPTFWINTGITVVLNAVTITYFITRLKDKVDNQDKDLSKIDRNTEKENERIRDDVKEVADRVTKVLLSIEGFTREQTILNQINSKLIDSHASKIEELQHNSGQQSASLSLLNDILRRRGVLD